MFVTPAKKGSAVISSLGAVIDSEDDREWYSKTLNYMYNYLLAGS